MGLMSGRLRLSTAFDLAGTLDSAQAFRWTREGDTYRGLVGARVVWLRQEGASVAWKADPPGDLGSWIRGYFRLEDPYDDICAALAAGEPRLARVIAAFQGLRLLRTDPWECLVSFIVSANNNVKRIEGIIDRMAAAFGAHIRPGVHAFPEPLALAGATLAELRIAGLGYRAPYVRDTARSILDTGLELERLRSEPLEEVQRVLLGFPGVGPKVADCVALFSLDKVDAFPVDVHVARACSQLYHRGIAMTPDRIRRLAQRRFGDHAGYAQQFLFQWARRGRSGDRVA